jgi:hypothetical protein
MTIPGWVPLLETVLAQSPPLPGALCRGRPDIFDATDENRRTEAIALCQHCPELDRCRAWAAALPHNGIHGVIAGEYREWVSHPSLRRQHAPTQGVAT